MAIKNSSYWIDFEIHMIAGSSRTILAEGLESSFIPSNLVWSFITRACRFLSVRKGSEQYGGSLFVRANGNAFTTSQLCDCFDYAEWR
ncbi:hypothetical protein OZ911_07000 [Pseudomonas fortuita]|uniref:Uncharacterized protein n=1 Tax=Pseudomonas fortuita TaxID=3233375 RepID=A0ACD4PEN8_9PSED|nr:MULTISPECIES: hypothetical protein [Pseudomonas]WAP66702.1 hypothetical protein OZ911_07000 [Pseudomonas putida]